MEQYKKEGQRQMPKEQQITASKSYTDILYGYLQSICKLDYIPNQKDRVKYIMKKDITIVELSKAINKTRQTTSKRLKKLIELGLVEELEDRYILPTLPSNKAFLVPSPTLRILNTTLKENTISIYIYLLNRYIANYEEPYFFYLDRLKEYIGISTKAKENNYIITDILLILKQLNLIDYEVKKIRNDNGQIQTKYKLISATNHLADC